jgi:hypothetical protein
LQPFIANLDSCKKGGKQKGKKAPPLSQFLSMKVRKPIHQSMTIRAKTDFSGLPQGIGKNSTNYKPQLFA